MNTTTTHNEELMEALSKAQGEFMAVDKDSQGHGYRYASLSEVIRAVKTPLDKHGLCVYHTVSADKNVLVSTLSHTSGQSISTEMPLLHEASNRANAMQALGGAITYARRYAMYCLLNLSVDDDDGEVSAPKKEASKGYVAEAFANEVECKEYQAIKKHIPDLDERLEKRFGREHYDTLKAVHVAYARGILKNKNGAAKENAH